MATNDKDGLKRWVETVTATEKSANIPLSPNTHILFLQTDLHTFPLRIS